MCEGLKNIFATNCIFKKIIRFYREKVVQEIEKNKQHLSAYIGSKYPNILYKY